MLSIIQGNRAQVDRVLYKKNMQEIILNTENLNVLTEAVDDLILTPEIDSSSNYKRFKAIGVVLGSFKN